MIQANNDRQRRHRTATSAESRRCPKCYRGAALRKHRDDMGTVTTCRYCDYEKATSI